MTMTLTMGLLRSMLTGTYRRHRPGSSRLARVSEGNLRGQVKRLEDARIGEHDVARDPAAGDREDLERVQPVAAAGLRRVRGPCGLPVGGELPYAPACSARLEHAVHEQAVVAAAPVPQRHWRHLQRRLIGEQPD